MKVPVPAAGGVLGVGIDLIACARVARVLERQGERFLTRVFTVEERAYCMGMKNPVPHLAARFAAKEAVAKCFSTGIGAELGWTSIGVRKGAREEPLVCLDERGRALLAGKGASDVLISLTHTETYGMAVALLVR
jgi:holo-[acyl-carrier protein] synthase